MLHDGYNEVKILSEPRLGTGARIRIDSYIYILKQTLLLLILYMMQVKIISSVGNLGGVFLMLGN